MDTVMGELERLHKIHGSDPRVCEVLSLPQNMNASVWAARNGAYVSKAALRKIQRKLFPEQHKSQPRPCPNAAQVALFNELGCSTWSEVIDAGLSWIEWGRRRDERFDKLMEKIKEKMDA